MAAAARFHSGLVFRTIMFILAFYFALILQMLLGNYQTVYIVEPLNHMAAQVENVSLFNSSVTDILSQLADYRWEYGDAQALIAAVREGQQEARVHLDEIDSQLIAESRNYYLLFNAHSSLAISFDRLLDLFIGRLQNGDIEAAADIYYSDLTVCGSYLLVYSQDLISTILEENLQRSEEISSMSRQIKNVQSVIIILTVLFGMLIIISITRILEVLSDMSRAAKAISSGNLDVPDISSTADEEIHNLASTFNEMKHSMKRTLVLIEEKNQMEKEAMQLQNRIVQGNLQMLRSQIRPHFLFNTINVIKYKCHEESAYESERLLGALGRLFRYSLASNEATVPLSVEIKVTEEYFLLCKARFQDKVNLEISFSPDLEVTEVLIPSFILQPVVENSFRHGLGPKETAGTVSVSIDRYDGLLRIAVTDDGVGMTAEKLEALRSSLLQSNDSGEHIGLCNVASRLALISHRCRMEIDSQPDVGTKVTLLLEYVVENEDEPEALDEGEEL